MEVHSPKIELNDRTLWFDGDNSVSEHYLIKQAQTNKSLDGLFVYEMSNNIRQYNKLIPSDKQIRVKTDCQTLSHEWNIPDEYKSLSLNDIRELLIAKLDDENISSDDDVKIRVHRIIYELKLFSQNNLLDIIRTLIYVINILHDNNVVWGVGRGSSVASYVLYLIGVHDVDSILYELDIHDFIRPTT